ncbi:MAG: glycosyltransferase family 2 protein [Paracoccaceae bacterium]
MPVFNARETLLRAVRSVRAQRRTDWELLIVDDGSQDGSAALARRLALRDDRLRVLCHGQRRWAAQARNTALRAARGRFIAFLDADDAWLPEKLHAQIGLMEQTGAAFTYTGFRRCSAKGTARSVRVPARVSRSELLRGNVIGCLTAAYDSRILGKCPMPELRQRHDHALWLDLLTRVPHATGLPEIHAIHYRQPASLSANTLRSAKATYAMLRGHAGLSCPRAAACLGAHYVNRVQNIYLTP